MRVDRMLSHRFRAVSVAAWGLMLMATGICLASGEQAEQPLLTPRELVDQLQSRVSAGWSDAAEGPIAQLAAHGDSALPAIDEGLGRGDENLSRALIRALARIPGDGATSFLVGVLSRGADSSLAREAVARLENRPVRRALSVAELATLVSLVRNGTSAGAGGAARVFAMCMLVEPATRTRPILERFLQEVLSDKTPKPDGISYVSPRVAVLNQFLLAFSYLGEPAAALLAEGRHKAGPDQLELRRWLALALGMARDPSVAPELEQVVRADPDPYVRWAAIHAYARSAGLNAIPLLKSLLDDETVSECPGCTDTGRPFYLLREAAAKELSWLETGGTP